MGLLVKLFATTDIVFIVGCAAIAVWVHGADEPSHLKLFDFLKISGMVLALVAFVALMVEAIVVIWI